MTKKIIQTGMPKATDMSCTRLSDEDFFYRYNAIVEVEGVEFYGPRFAAMNRELVTSDNTGWAMRFTTFNDEKTLTEVNACPSPLRHSTMYNNARRVNGETHFSILENIPQFSRASACGKDHVSYKFFMVCRMCSKPLTQEEANLLNDYIGVDKDISFLDDLEF